MTFRLHAEPFKRGFQTVMPLWLAAAPFAVAYAVSAKEAGLEPLVVQFMSLTVYSAAAQMGAVQLLSTGAPFAAIVATAVVMNLHHSLYGLSLARQLELSRAERAVAAYFLTDGAYGVTAAAGTRANFSFLLGAECSMFLAWNLFTALGLLLGALVAIPASAHLGFIAPLTFFLLLVSSIKTRTDVQAAIISAVTAILCLAFGLGHLALLIAGIAGPFIGAWTSERRDRQQKGIPG